MPGERCLTTRRDRRRQREIRHYTASLCRKVHGSVPDEIELGLQRFPTIHMCSKILQGQL
jgi:hypothetical protein